MLIRNYMEELRETTNLSLYEGYRTLKIKKNGGFTGMVNAHADSNTLAKLDQTKIAHEQKMAKMEAEMRSVFQQKVAEKEAKLKQSESELNARHKEMKDQLEKQKGELEERIKRLELNSSRPGTPDSAATRTSWKKTGLFK